MTMDPSTKRAIERLASEVATLRRSVRVQARKPQLGHSSVDPGAGSVRLGPEDATHATAGADGIRVFIPAPEGDGDLVEAIALGTPDGSAWQSMDADGTVLGSMSSTGDLSAQAGTFDGTLTAGGPVILNGDPATGHGSGQHGPTINSRDLLGQTVQDFIENHPGEDPDNPSPWMDGTALGVVANGWADVAGWTYDGINSQPDYRAIMSISWEAVEGRAYQVAAAFPAWQSTDTVTDATMGISILKISTEPGGRVGLGTEGKSLPGGRLYAPSGCAYSPSTTINVRCPQDVPAGQATVLAANYVYAGRQAKHVEGDSPSTQCSLTVYDAGRADPTNQAVIRTERQQGTATPPPASDPPKPTKRSFTWEKPAGGMRTFRGSGSIAPSIYNGKAGQGQSIYATQNGILRSEITFPYVADYLTGADISAVYVYLYFSWWDYGSGGTACIGTHGDSVLSASWGDVFYKSADLVRSSFPKPGGHWVKLPASTHDDIKSGRFRGVILTAPNTDRRFYGYVTAARLRVTGKK